jgi:hypothetical protein
MAQKRGIWSILKILQLAEEETDELAMMQMYQSQRARLVSQLHTAFSPHTHFYIGTLYKTTITPSLLPGSTTFFVC